MCLFSGPLSLLFSNFGMEESGSPKVSLCEEPEKEIMELVEAPLLPPACSSKYP